MVVIVVIGMVLDLGYNGEGVPDPPLVDLFTPLFFMGGSYRGIG